MAGFLVDEVLPRSLALRMRTLGSHPGMVIARLPSELPAPHRVELIVATLQNIDPALLPGNLIIVEPGKVRIRRHP